VKPYRVAVIAVRPIGGEVGGAERFYEGLTAALNTAGVQADLVNIVSDESCFESIEETYLRCYDLDVSTYDGVISTKAPTYLVRHPNHICYLVHTMRVFYDMFEQEFPHPTPELLKQRALIHQLDTAALQYPRTKKIFVIGQEVRNRLRHYNGLDAEVVHPALAFDGFRCASYDYIFMPGRLHRWKRVDLIIEAMRSVDRPVLLKIAGTGEDEPQFRQLAKNDERIVFLGRVSDQALLDGYAEALVVPFVPIREDFGLVTLEAFRSCKPVITCTDSGEPSHLVVEEGSGFVCSPEPREIAAKVVYLYDHPDVARTMGARGATSIQHMTWANVAARLLNILGMT
jgi:glycosyltransferase involved in cell wall biosynthesis